MIINWDVRYPLDSHILSLMQDAADCCSACEKMSVSCSVSVCLCDDAYIRDMNHTYRKIDKSTDVLSFPTVAYPPEKTAGECPELIRKEFDDETGTCFLGDIIISVPHILAQAHEYGHSELREAVYLLVHGICHLMGYDHISDHDKERMRIMEEKILSSIAPMNDSCRNSEDQALLQLARDAMARSYSPYSHFPVGAALRSTDGQVFLGCNIENASFGLTNCAERTAVFKAVSEGVCSFDTIAIAAKGKAWPCGACRQVLNEFAPDIRVMITWDDHVEEKMLKELLPVGFGPNDVNI